MSGQRRTVADSTGAGFIEQVLHDAAPGPLILTLRFLLLPLALLHQAWLELYLLPFHLGWRKRFRVRGADGAPVPVISIGNLVSGGTGKTPMAQLVAGHLRLTGCRVALLSRGHGGSAAAASSGNGGGATIVSDGAQILLGPAEAGDEPSLLARSLPGVPVLIGRDRRRSARLAVERFAPNVIVLDDALQYWQLHRDLDIVLLDARRPFDNGYILPRGLLREPPSHLARAGIVVLTRVDAATPAALLDTLARVKVLAPRASVFTATHMPLGWVSHASSRLLPLASFEGRRAFVFSGIADNSAFRDSVEAKGVTIAAAAFFGDHHAYDSESVEQLAKIAVRASVDLVLTTEKDLVKAGPLWPHGVEAEICALRIGMAIADEMGFLTVLDDMCGL